MLVRIHPSYIVNIEDVQVIQIVESDVWESPTNLAITLHMKDNQQVRLIKMTREEIDEILSKLNVKG